MVMNTEKFIMDHIEYAELMAATFSKISNIDSEELLSYAYEGLMVAAQNYDENNSGSNGYLYQCVSGLLLTGIYEIKGYGPNYIYWECERALKRLYENIDNREYIDIDIADLIAEEILKNLQSGEKEKKKKELKNLILLNYASHLEEMHGNCDLIYLEKLSKTIEEESYYHELKSELFKALEVLNDREKKVIIEKYGLNDEGMKTYKEIAEKHDVHKNKIRQIEAKALKKLRQPKISNRLVEYLNSDTRINGSNPSVEVGRSIC